MVTMQVIEDQLKAIGADFHFWGRAEKRELRNILVPGETIHHCLNGRYEGGFAMLCATDRRLLLVDKKPLYMTLEDVRYDMISEVDFSHHLLDASMKICTVNKTLTFMSWHNGELRKLTAFLQDKVMETRHQQLQPTSVQLPAYQLGQDLGGVAQLQYKATNPYTRVPLLMRRRVSRYYS
jgi:Bacterial PH domain